MITSKAFYLIVLYYLDPHSSAYIERSFDTEPACWAYVEMKLRQDNSDPWLCLCQQMRDQSEVITVRAHR